MRCSARASSSSWPWEGPFSDRSEPITRAPILLALATVAAVSACGSGDGEPVDLATKSIQGDVSFDLTPSAADGGGLVLSVQANTHSGNLAELDLRKAFRLEADGRTWEPVEATALSGHHAAATVRFEVTAVPERFAVTIRGVRDLPEQRVDWP